MKIILSENNTSIKRDCVQVCIVQQTDSDRVLSLTGADDATVGGDVHVARVMKSHGNVDA